MADDKKFKTLEELSIARLSFDESNKLIKTLNLKDMKELELLLKSSSRDFKIFLGERKRYVKTLEEEKKLLIDLERFRREHATNARHTQALLNEEWEEFNKSLDKTIEKKDKLAEKQKEQQKQISITKDQYRYLYDTVSGAIDKVIKQSEDLFKISHDLQVQGNMTWNDYTRLYNDSFQAIRDMNTALGQSVFNTRQLFEAQQRLVPQGWKGIDPERLTELGGAVMQINAVLGTFPEELSTAFQMSFRQFEAQTDRFVYAIGNRLNAFSDSFGVTVGALTGAVTQMMAANTYLARNNMQAQIMANESLMAAVALSGAVGIETSNFMVGLAQTTQFGTAAQMSELYQTGALLQGFSVGDFQSRMRSQDYMGATMDLITSIQGTLGGMEDGYLKNEYIQRISQGLGLSQNDILQIMTNDYNLSEKALEIQEKLLEADTSMEKELAGLKVALMDRLENWWDSSSISQGFGKVLQDYGLVGVNRQLRQITIAILGQSMQQSIWDTMVGAGGIGSSGTGSWSNLGRFFGGGGAAGGVGIPGAGTGAAGLSAMQRMGLIGGGIGVGAAGMYAGSKMHQSEHHGAVGSGIMGSLLNIGSGAASGAMLGTAIGPIGTGAGALIGGAVGAAKSIMDISKRRETDQSALDKMNDQSIMSQRESGESTGDPLLDEIGLLRKSVNQILGVVDVGFMQDREIQATLSMTDTAKTK